MYGSATVKRDHGKIQATTFMGMQVFVFIICNRYTENSVIVFKNPLIICIRCHHMPTDTT